MADENDTDFLGLSLDTVGYVRLRQSYRKNMAILAASTGLSLPVVTTGKVAFEANFRANMAKIAAARGIAIATRFVTPSGLKHAFDTAMRQIDVSLSGGIPPLGSLTQAASSVVENTTAGTVITGILDKSPGSSLTLHDDAGGRFFLPPNSTDIVAGLVAIDFETTPTLQVIVRETRAGAPNSPRDTVFNFSVSNVFEKPNLNALTLLNLPANLIQGVAVTGAIGGAAAGSGISAAGLPTGLTINGSARTWGWSGSGSVASGTLTLTETLVDSPNSGRQSLISYAITQPDEVRTLSNTQTNSTVDNTTVQGFAAAFGPMRTQLIAAGRSVAAFGNRSVVAILTEMDAATETDSTPEPTFPVFSIGNAASVSEGNPSAPPPPVFSISDATAVSEGN